MEQSSTKITSSNMYDVAHGGAVTNNVDSRSYVDRHYYIHRRYYVNRYSADWAFVIVIAVCLCAIAVSGMACVLKYRGTKYHYWYDGDGF